MKRTLYLYLLLIFVCCCVGCTNVDHMPQLTVSIEPQRYLLERIAGDQWNVNVLLDKGADPESFNPSMSAIAGAMNSKAFFRIGNMPFEDQLTDRITEGEKNVKIVDSSNGIEMIVGTHCCHDHHGHDDSDSQDLDSGVDPHVWSSVRNAMTIADNMLKAMVELDNENADIYRSNHAKLKAELQALDDEISLKLSQSRGRSFLVWHPSLSYFARDYELEQISLGAENKESSVADFREKIDLAKAHNVGVFLIQPEYDQQRSKEVADQASAKVATVNLLSYDWVDEMRNVADAIVESENGKR